MCLCNNLKPSIQFSSLLLLPELYSVEMITTCFVMLICVCVLSFVLGSASSVSFQEFTLLAQGNDYNDVLNVMEVSEA